jgi:hypothetical protein
MESFLGFANPRLQPRDARHQNGNIAPRMMLAWRKEGTGGRNGNGFSCRYPCARTSSRAAFDMYDLLADGCSENLPRAGLAVNGWCQHGERLQVLLDDDEMREIAALARSRKMTVSSWVRHVLREARSRYPRVAGDRKLQVVRAAAKHAFPTADMGKMLEEIESGYLAESSK